MRIIEQDLGFGLPNLQVPITARPALDEQRREDEIRSTGPGPHLRRCPWRDAPRPATVDSIVSVWQRDSVRVAGKLRNECHIFARLGALPAECVRTDRPRETARGPASNITPEPRMENA